jgi:hypothetical protein
LGVLGDTAVAVPPLVVVWKSQPATKSARTWLKLAMASIAPASRTRDKSNVAYLIETSSFCI